MAKYLTFSEYARLKGVSDRTVRNWKEQGKISVTTKSINNRNTLVVIVEDEYEDIQNTFKDSKPTFEENSKSFQSGFESVKDAELITESTSYSLVSMENSTFEGLIKSIKELAEARAESDLKAYSKMETEYFESKAENKQLDDEIKKLYDEILQNKINAAQLEAEIKILQLRHEEQAEKLTEKDKIISDKIQTIQSMEEKFSSSANNSIREISIKDSQINSLNEELRRVKNDLEHKSNSFNELQSKYDSLKEKYNEIQSRHNEDEINIHQLKDELTKIKGTIPYTDSTRSSHNDQSWFRKL